jgi:hypothetical protein
VTKKEEAELRGLVIQAWQLRDTPYFVDACAAIVDWSVQRPLAALYREQAFDAAVAALAAAYPDRYARAAA